jgi:hypothetical protein
MMNSLVQDFRKLKDEDIERHADKIYFCRFINMIPSDKLMASNMQTLLDSMCNIISTKGLKEELKNIVLISFKYLIE